MRGVFKGADKLAKLIKALHAQAFHAGIQLYMHIYIGLCAACGVLQHADAFGVVDGLGYAVCYGIGRALFKAGAHTEYGQLYTGAAQKHALLGGGYAEGVGSSLSAGLGDGNKTVPVGVGLDHTHHFCALHMAAEGAHIVTDAFKIHISNGGAAHKIIS